MVLYWSQVDDAVSTDVEQTVVSLSAAKMDEVSLQPMHEYHMLVYQS